MEFNLFKSVFKGLKKGAFYSLIVTLLIAIQYTGSTLTVLAEESDPFNGQVIVKWEGDRAYNEFDQLITNQWAYDVDSTDDQFVKLDGVGFEIERKAIWKAYVDPNAEKGFVQPVYMLDPEHPNFNELIGRVVETNFYEKNGTQKTIQFELKPGRNMGPEIELTTGDWLISSALNQQISLDLININKPDTVKVGNNEVVEVLFNVELPESIKNENAWKPDEGIDVPEPDEKVPVETEKKKANWKTVALVIVAGIAAVLGIGGYLIVKKLRED